MNRKKILALCLALLMLTGGVFSLSACEATNDLPGNNGGAGGTPRQDLISGIKTDGMTFSIDSINAVKTASEIMDGEALPVVGDMETLLKLLLDRGVLYDNSAWQQEKRMYAYGEDSLMIEPAPGGSAPAPSAPVPDSAASIPAMAPEMAMDAGGGGTAGSHSQTNEQVAGVNEGDIVKTDGQYIYAMSPGSNSLRIIRADGARLEVVSTLTLDNIWGAEFYLIGNDRLVIVGNEYIQYQTMPGDGANTTPSLRIAPDFYGWYRSDFTAALIYDISDRTAPVLARKVSMDGWAVSTRVIGDTIYLVTNKYIWNIPFDEADSPMIRPYCLDTAEGEEFTAIGLESIYYVPDTNDSSYLLIGAIDVYSDEPFAPKAYLGAGSNLYMSRDAMYIAQTKWVQLNPRSGDMVEWWWPTGGEKTDILRFAINGTDVSYTGTGSVVGSPINQYSMDEYNGYFRIATTDWNSGTYVTILNSADMRTVGRTEPLAPGERMQSMRFTGDMGYVVTFENMDPLFTIDLTDPYNPRVLGELKIPGFSQYLHPVGNGLLLGIGRDTQETYTRDSRGVETVIGFIDTGIKVSLFDVSNPFDPREIDVLRLGEGWAEVSNNPRALMCDPSRNLYGFAMENWGNRGYWPVNALILNVENGKISVAATLKLEGYYGMYGSRLCYIGNTLYFVHETGVDIYAYNTFEKLGSLSF